MEELKFGQIVFNKIPHETIFHKKNLSGWCIIHRLYLLSSIMHKMSLAIHTHKKSETTIIRMRALKEMNSFFFGEIESLFDGHLGQHGRKWGRSDLF